MAQKVAPAEKNSTDIYAASATFCISADHPDLVLDALLVLLLLIVSDHLTHIPDPFLDLKPLFLFSSEW